MQYASGNAGNGSTCQTPANRSVRIPHHSALHPCPAAPRDRRLRRWSAARSACCATLGLVIAAGDRRRRCCCASRVSASWRASASEIEAGRDPEPRARAWRDDPARRPAAADSRLRHRHHRPAAVPAAGARPSPGASCKRRVVVVERGFSAASRGPGTRSARTRRSISTRTNISQTPATPDSPWRDRPRLIARHDGLGRRPAPANLVLPDSPC